MKKILITGCAGFIGSHTCEWFLKNTDYKVYGIDNLDPYYDISFKQENLDILNKYKNFIFKKDDIRYTNIIGEIIPDHIIHLASMAGVRYSIENPNIYIDVNVNGFIHILQECIKYNVNEIIYASSSSVYGMNTKIPFSENDEINSCNSIYACSKLMMEKIAKTYFQLYGIKSIGLRFFTVYGPRGRPDMAPRKFMESIARNKPINKYGDGTSFRDYTFISDIVSGIINSLDRLKDIKCDVFNLGNDTPVTLNEFIKECEKITHKKAIINQMTDQKGDVPFTHADISKSRKLLDYNPNVKLSDGLLIIYHSLKG